MAEKAQGRTGRLPAEVAAMIPDRLLDAATVLFTENGYGRTTMEAIARKARASTKTVYSRYADKDKIFTAVVQRLLDRAAKAVDRLQSTSSDTADPRAFLIHLGRQLVIFTEASEIVDLHRLVLAESPRFPPLAEALIAVCERPARFVTGPIQKWRDLGYLPYISDTKLAATLFIELVSSRPRTRALLLRPLGREEADAIVIQAVDLFLRGAGFTFDEAATPRTASPPPG